MPLSQERKKEYFAKLEGLLDSYSKVFVVLVDNVRSSQMAQVRQSLRGRAEVLMGKNTMIRKVFNKYLADNPGHPYEQILPQIKGNIGFVFTNDDLSEVRDRIMENRVPAPARVGAIAPCDVYCPAGPTGCDPGQTSFFQALQIATKIQRGQIEILNDVLLTKKGEKVGSSEAVLLQKLNILPFTYGLEVKCVYDNGSLFDPAVLDLSEADIINKFMDGVRQVAAVCLEIGYPTLASLPHSIANAFRTLVAVAVECEEFSFKKADPFKAYLKDPSAFASAAPAAAGAGGAAAAAQEEEEEEEEEADIDLGGGGMFGDDGDDY